MLSDRNLEDAIKLGGKAAEDALLQICRSHDFRKPVEKLVKRHGGSKSDAADLFQEGLYLFWKKIRSGEFRGESKLSTWFYGICQNIWLNEMTKIKRRERLLAVKAADLKVEKWQKEETPLLFEEKVQCLEALFKQLGDGCRELLLLAQSGYNGQYIAAHLGYKSDKVVKTKKSKCLRELRLMLLNNPSLAKKIIGEP